MNKIILLLFLVCHYGCNGQSIGQTGLPFTIDIKQYVTYTDIVIRPVNFDSSKSELDSFYSNVRFWYKNVIVNDNETKLYIAYGKSMYYDLYIVDINANKIESVTKIPFRNVSLQSAEIDNSQGKIYAHLSDNKFMNSDDFLQINGSSINKLLTRQNCIVSFSLDNFNLVDTFSTSSCLADFSPKLFNSLFTIYKSGNKKYLNCEYLGNDVTIVDTVVFNSIRISNKTVNVSKGNSLIAYDIEQKKIWSIPIEKGGIKTYKILHNTDTNLLFAAVFGDTTVSNSSKYIQNRFDLYLYNKVNGNLITIYSKKYFPVESNTVIGKDIYYHSLANDFFIQHYKDHFVFTFTGIDTTIRDASQFEKVFKYAHGSQQKTDSFYKVRTIITNKSEQSKYGSSPMKSIDQSLFFSANIVFSMTAPHSVSEKYYEGFSVLKYPIRDKSLEILKLDSDITFNTISEIESLNNNIIVELKSPYKRLNEVAYRIFKNH